MARILSKSTVLVLVCALTTAMTPRTLPAEVVSFEGLGLTAADQYENGAHMPSGGFESHGLKFNNSYFVDPQWGESWMGWAYSSKTDNVTRGYLNQYSAMPGKGADNSLTYAIGYVGFDFVAGETYHPTIVIPEKVHLQSARISNTTYAYWAMVEGVQGLSKQFTPSDWFKLTIEGLDGAGQSIGSIDLMLAENGTIKSAWELVDLSSLSDARKLVFSLASTDNDLIYGMNTPAFFAMDNLSFARVPEPSMVVMLVSGVAALVVVRRMRRGSR